MLSEERSSGKSQLKKKKKKVVGGTQEKEMEELKQEMLKMSKGREELVHALSEVRVGKRRREEKSSRKRQYKERR